MNGVQVGENNTVEFVSDIPRVLLSSGKPLVTNIVAVLSSVMYLFPICNVLIIFSSLIGAYLCHDLYEGEVTEVSVLNILLY